MGEEGIAVGKPAKVRHGIFYISQTGELVRTQGVDDHKNDVTVGTLRGWPTGDARYYIRMFYHQEAYPENYPNRKNYQNFFHRHHMSPIIISMVPYRSMTS